MHDRDFFERAAREHLITGDLFSYAHPVIPIMTKGRAYGSISTRVLKQGVPIPVLALNGAAYVDPYIFLALWGDAGGYTADRISQCAQSCLRVAAIELKLDTLAMPVLGGKEGFKYLWAAERGLLEQADLLDERGIDVPEHVFVTDRVAT